MVTASVINDSKAKQIINGALAVALSLAASLSVFTSAFATSSPVIYTKVPFSTSEVQQWTPDRTSPTGGYGSISYGDRDDVLEIRLAGSLASEDNYAKTEGIRRDIKNSDAIKADLYVDPSWGSQKVRAGLWGVGNDQAGGITGYPIVEYSTDHANQGGYPETESGWRYWEVDHWMNLTGVAVKAGWNTLEIIHDDTNHKFIYRVNDKDVATVEDENSAVIGEAILNSKNYGQDYATHWSKFAYGDLAAVVPSKEACMNDGWKSYMSKERMVFKNQGQCVAAVASKNK